MNRTLVKLAMAGIILLSACAPKQTVSDSVNQKQTAVTPSTVSAQNIPARTEESDRSSYKPKSGYVPDEQTAISIAVAVWTPTYGKENIEGEKPYKATLKGGVWIVTGTLPEGSAGGTAVAEISKDSGCILRVIHYE